MAGDFAQRQMHVGLTGRGHVCASQEARNSQDPSLAEAAGWAYAAISKAVQAAGAAPQQ